MGRDCGCGPKKTLHQVVMPSGKPITYTSEAEARAAAARDGGTYQATVV